MNSTRQIKISAILSYFQMALSIVISLIYTPLMIKILGQSEYGLYNTVASTISMISIINLGFNSSYIRFFARYKNNDDKEGIAKLNGLYLLIFLFLGAVALFCGFYLSMNLDKVFDSGLVEEEYHLAKKLMMILTVNMSISFPMSVFGNIISSHERFVFLKTLSIIKTVGSPLLTIPLLLLGYGSASIVIVTLIIHIIIDTCYMLYTFLVLKQKFIFTNIDITLFKELFVFTSFIAINIIVDQINLNVDKLLLTRFKGTSAVAVYSVGYTLYAYYQMFSTCISSLFTPRVHKIISSSSGMQQKMQLTNLFIRVGRIQFLILALVSSGMVLFGKQFITKFWAGEGYDESYYVTILLVLPSIIPLIQNIGIEVQRAQNKHKFRSFAYLLMAIINILMSYALCQKYGAVGSTIGTGVSFIIANGILINIYYQRECNVDILSFWDSIIRMTPGLIIPILFGIFLNKYVYIGSMFIFLICIISYTFVYCISMWCISMSTEEKNILIHAIDTLKYQG